MTILIAGGGIGGLTLALMLHKRGIKSVVYEQASQIREVGVGINTLPHAIKELAVLGLLPALDAVAIRTKELIYINRLGQKIWSEPRGADAGFEYPQFSIHRGRLQKVIHDAVVAELGPDAVRTGMRLAGFLQDEGGVTAHFTDARFGASSETVRGEALVAADGIHSVARRHFYPEEGRPNWQGVMLWRGATEWPQFLTGRSMYIGGGMGAKLALYPIAPGSTPETRLTNWAIAIRIADGAITPAPVELLVARRPHGGSRALRLALHCARRRRRGVGARDPGLLGISDVRPRSPAALEFRPRHADGRRRASDVPGRLQRRRAGDPRRAQPRRLARKADHPMHALYAYEEDRLAKTAEIVRLNRKGGPERVIDEVEKLAPAGFEYIDRVLSRDEREAIVKGYAGKAGFALSQVNK